MYRYNAKKPTFFLEFLIVKVGSFLDFKLFYSCKLSYLRHLYARVLTFYGFCDKIIKDFYIYAT